MMVLGVVAGGFVVYAIARKQNLNTGFLFDLIVYSLLFGILGARVLYVILYHNQFADVKEMLFIWFGGLVSYGGMAGGLLCAYLMLKQKKENVYKWFDIGIIGINLGWAIGRIGCLLNGDSYGLLSSSKIAIWGRFPTQLFETFWCLLVSIGLYLIYNNKDKFKLPDGVIFYLGLALYAIGRFVIDFWRDENIILIGLKAGQIGSLIILIISALLIVKLIKNRKEVRWS
jgi:phosphatidylglycerol:prolipoprotein diacylglycerol transferase